MTRGDMNSEQLFYGTKELMLILNSMWYSE